MVIDLTAWLQFYFVRLVVGLTIDLAIGKTILLEQKIAIVFFELSL